MVLVSPPPPNRGEGVRRKERIFWENMTISWIGGIWIWEFFSHVGIGNEWGGVDVVRRRGVLGLILIRLKEKIKQGEKKALMNARLQYLKNIRSKCMKKIKK